ncbi:MAG: hypothetical protein GX130_03055 [Candidatus Hydrogenedens sp.]|jgi:hypothetical protein|nr:hypothetical protein [Candidatus Hydrogenedens sp.]
MESFDLSENLRVLPDVWDESGSLKILKESWTEAFPPASLPDENTAFVISVAVPPFKTIQKSPVYNSMPARQRRHLANYSDDRTRRHKCMAHLLRRKIQEHFPDSSWKLSTSHSGNWILVACALTPVGVDMQQIRDPHNYLAVTTKLFSPDTQKALVELDHDPEMRSLFFTWSWTALEAQFKLEEGELLLPFLKDIAEDSKTWERKVHLHHFRVDDKHLACLARARKAPPPLLYRFSSDDILNPV